jgi:hypothetical protein
VATPIGKSPGPASPGPSGVTVAVAGGLVGVAAVVFFVLPRWSATPVVTNEATPSTSLAPRPSPTPLATAPARSLPPPAPEPDPAPPATKPDPAVQSAAPPAGDFEAAVGEGLAALDRGAPGEARAAFQRAEGLRPGTGVVKDGLARSEAGLRAEALEAHRRRAEAAEAAEDWRAAVREYEAALKVEPAVRFAVEGASRAGERADASDRLETYLRRPDRLATEEVAREAEIALDRATEIPSPGSKLMRQAEQLRALLAAAATEVTVRLLSDERTEVSVLRVGALGRFREKALTLRPGSYVVVGTRAGYRDSRHTLVVPPGRSPEPLTVRCQEVL